MSTAGGKGASESDMVFEAEEQPALPPEMLKGKGKGAADGGDGGKEGGKSSYVGEDGVRYRYNEGMGEWEEAPAGEGGESDDEEEEDEGDGDEEEQLSAVLQQAQGGGAAASVGGAQPEKRKRKKKKKSGWDKASNKWVYVTGLPADVTPEEVGLGSGCGFGGVCGMWCVGCVDGFTGKPRRPPARTDSHPPP